MNYLTDVASQIHEELLFVCGVLCPSANAETKEKGYHLAKKVSLHAKQYSV